MPKTYLYYDLKGVSTIQITACSTCLDLLRFSQAKFVSKDIVYSNLTSRGILQELEKLIIKETGEHPCTRDILEGTKYDDIKKFSDYMRHFGFLPSAAWPVVDETDEEFKKQNYTNKQKNKSLHGKVFPVYKAYVKANSNK